MEFAVLNSQFQPAKLVEGHSSLIWTERWSSNGDFQRESFDIGGTIATLPLEDPVNNVPPTFVTLRDSTVPMIVETHVIQKSLTGQPKIVTYGRSAETVLNRRTTIKTPLGGGAKIHEPWTSVQKTAVDAAYDAMNLVVTLGSASVLDKIDEIEIKAPIRPPGYVAPSTNQNYQVDPGELYQWVLNQVQSEKYGLRAVRPATTSVTKIAIEIYTGTDRTTKVVFDARFDQFDDSKYVLSRADWKNADQVGALNDSLEVNNGTAYSGLKRRVTFFDASQIATGAAGSTLTNIMTTLGKVDLAKRLETALFSGEVSRQKGAAYGKDYFLGDVVKLSGDYGLSQFVRIAEFIRSEDSSGEKAYPTFASL